MQQLGSHCTISPEIWSLSRFRKPVEKIQVSSNSNKQAGTLQEGLSTFIPEFFLEWEMSLSDHCKGTP
jgi:hypothetical protein